MKKLRLAIMCLACAGLLVVPSAADAQKQRPGAGPNQQTGRCKGLQRKLDSANQRLAGEQADVTDAKATVAKRKRAYNKAKSKGKVKKAKAKRRLKKAKAALKIEKASLKHAQDVVASVNRQFAAAGCGG